MQKKTFILDAINQDYSFDSTIYLSIYLYIYIMIYSYILKKKEEMSFDCQQSHRFLIINAC